MEDKLEYKKLYKQSKKDKISKMEWADCKEAL